MNKWFVPLVLLVAPALLMAGGAPPNSDSLPTEVAKGRQIYEQYCAACHGWQGEGAANWNKPDEKGEMPPPPHDETGHTWRHSDAMLVIEYLRTLWTDDQRRYQQNESQDINQAESPS